MKTKKKKIIPQIIKQARKLEEIETPNVYEFLHERKLENPIPATKEEFEAYFEELSENVQEYVTEYYYSMMPEIEETYARLEELKLNLIDQIENAVVGPLDKISERLKSVY